MESKNVLWTAKIKFYTPQSRPVLKAVITPYFLSYDNDNLKQTETTML